jgi:hypothetical protein
MAQGLALRTLQCAGVVALQFCLCGFYYSDKPLLGVGQLKFRGQFRTVEIDRNGDVLKQPDNKSSVINFVSSGLSYTGIWEDKSIRLTLSEFDTAAHLFTFQLEISNADGSAPLITYGLMTIEGQTVQLFFPQANARPETRDQLMDAIRVLTAHLSSARVVRFGVGMTRDQMIDIGFQVRNMAKDTSNTLAEIVRAAPEPPTNDDDAAFPTSDYFSPSSFRLVYNNALTPDSFRSQSVYWYTFVYAFHADRECARLVDDATFARFLNQVQFSELKTVLDSVVMQKRDYRVGDWGAAVKSTVDAMAPNMQRNISFIIHGQDDAQRFIKHHGCSSDVANRFFSNVAKTASRLY